MAIPGVITSQTGAHQYDGPDMTSYAMFVGGVNATHHALKQYTPLLNGFGRLFMIRPPKMCLKMFAGSDALLYSKDSQFIQFKHMLEYMNRSITGMTDKRMEEASTPIQGGFAGRKFNTPVGAREETAEITVSIYEMAGCLASTVIEMWMNGIGDELSGLAHYGGWVSGGRDELGKEKRLYRRSNESDDGIPFNEANHTCEFIYVIHDRTGAQVERAVLLADCYPKGLQQTTLFEIPQGGTHDNVTLDVQFNCVVYRSPIINAVADDLLKQFRIVSNTMNMNPEVGDAVYANNNVNLFNRSLGAVPVNSSTGTNIGNLPAFASSNAPKTIVSNPRDMNLAKLAGQPGHGPNPSWDGFAP